WNEARSQAQIQTYLDVEMEPPFPAALITYYPMNGFGQTLTDAAGTAHGQRGAGAGSDAADPIRSLDSPAFVPLESTPPSGHSVSFDDGTINAAEAASVSFTFSSAEVGTDYSYTISSSGSGTP